MPRGFHRLHGAPGQRRVVIDARELGAVTVSKLVTIWPASARCSVRAVRKMVSPSGIVIRASSGGSGAAAPECATRRICKPSGDEHEAGLFEEARQEMFARPARR